MEEKLKDTEMESVLQNANDLFKNGNTEEAVELYKKLSEQGNAKAQNRLGNCYYSGNGVEQDYEEAVKWYKLSAQKYCWGQYNLANCYYWGNGTEENNEEAMRYYQLAYKNGIIYAANRIGEMYEKGYGVEEDIDEAVKWYKRAAENGNKSAQVKLGDWYYNGNGVEEDIYEALKWYVKAAEQGDDHAALQAGIIELEDNNYAQAVTWFEQAAKNGDADAQNRLAIRYSNGQGVKKDEKMAEYWWKKSAKQGYVKAQQNLANYYYDGVNYGRDYEQAIYWHKKLADQGNTWSKYVLANCYFYGFGFSKDYEKAVEMYNELVFYGCAAAEARLGDSYLLGRGNEVNRDEALQWYVKASKHGDKETTDMLKNCGSYIVISYPSEFLRNEKEYKTEYKTGNVEIYELENKNKKYTFNIEFCNIPIQNYHVKFKITKHTGGVMMDGQVFQIEPFTVEWGDYMGDNTFPLYITRNYVNVMAPAITVEVFCAEAPECCASINISSMGDEKMLLDYFKDV